MFNKRRESEEPGHDNPNHAGMQSHRRQASFDDDDFEELGIGFDRAGKASRRMEIKSKIKKPPAED